MRLLHLDISGFKSFPDPVSLDFAGGITAIVGPNGCGKSNLSEAMTWVLGEQSAKSLRGGRMEDVIFNGSQQRKPLGMAEACLVLDAQGEKVPELAESEDGRVSIGRRVFRTGESQYRMNGKVVRLKDVKDFLMDTGLGIRAYSVIEQGKIGMILSGKPQERRKLLEEAAGITRYKARKRIAEMKLEEATANLLRLDDVVGEVERSLRSLKRQASAARRWQKKNDEHRRLLAWVLEARWRGHRDRLERLDEHLTVTQEREAVVVARLTRDEAALTAGRETLEELAQELADRHQRQAELAATIEGRQEFIKGAKGTLEEILERAGRGREQAERRHEELLRFEAELSQLVDRRSLLVVDLESASSEVTRDEEAIAGAERDLRQAQGRLEELRQELLAGSDTVNRLRQKVQQAQIELERGAVRRGHLDRELEEHLAELTQAEEAAQVAAERVRQLSERRAERQQRLDGVTGRLDATVKEEAEATQARQRAHEALSEARQRHRLLTELSRAHAERRARLTDALERAGLTDPVFLAERLRAVEGWERSLDVYLAELTDAVLLDADADGLALARAVTTGADEDGENDTGIATGALLVRPLERVPESFPVVDDDAVALSLGEALGLSEGVAAALPPAYLVDRPEDAERLARSHPGVAFLSREGFWASGGTLHGEAREAAPGVLERQRELAALDDALPGLETTLTEATARLEGLVARRAELAKEKNTLEGQLAQVRQELAVATARAEDTRERRERLSAEQGELTDEQAELAREVQTAETRRKELAAELGQAEEAYQGVEERLDAAREAVEAAKARREQLRTASADRRGRLHLLEERLAAHDRETERARREIDERRQQREAWKAEAERLDSRREELEAAVRQADRQLQEALEGRSASQDEVLAAQETLDDHRARLKELEARVTTAREERDEVRSALEALRVDRAGLRQDAGHAAASYREHFGVPLPGAEPIIALVAPEEEDAAAVAEDNREDDSDDSEADAEETQPSGLAARLAALAQEESDDEGSDDGETAEGDPAQAAQPAGPPEFPEDWQAPESLQEGEATLEQLKRALDRLGPVNVLAMEEYEEQQERHGFLIEQRADVAESVESLRRTIREINRTSSERFAETFEQVNRSFAETFVRLFRGGEAEMRLLDEEDVLESGIEILARPPGKRLQNIMLLSGGEKALTAIALLFALFQTKPSPFCILDEVDAPLDDVNTVRFVELLQEMARDTQFIIITHNKITMEIADTLYGVTMEEKGVSKLVSVEVDTVQPAQAQTA